MGQGHLTRAVWTTYGFLKRCVNCNITFLASFEKSENLASGGPRPFASLQGTISIPEKEPQPRAFSSPLWSLPHQVANLGLWFYLLLRVSF